MAVNIPVVIDIDKAFEEAANRVSSAIRPMRQQIEDATSKLKFVIGFEDDRAITQELGKLLTSFDKFKGAVSKPTYGIKELSTALEDAKNRFSSLIAVENSGQSVNLQYKRSLEESIVLLTSEIEQRTHAADLVQRQTMEAIQAKRAEEERAAILQREAVTISSLNSKLGALRGNLENAVPGSAQWKQTAKDIEKVTADLEQLNSSLAMMGTKSGSINRISLQMKQLSEQWNQMSRTQKFDKDGNLTKSAQKVIDKYRQLTEESKKYGLTLEQYVNRGTNALRTQSRVLQSVMSYASMYVSVFGAIRFVKQIRDVTAELEYQRVALGHLIQDEEYGAQLFERIKERALTSPFRITQLVTFTKQMAAYRIEQEKLFDTTNRLADVSAGLGVEMNRLILAYGQVRAASVLRGQELRQFTEAGLPLVDLLAEKMGELHNTTYKTADVFKLISERAVPFSAIAEIFEDLTDKGGMFYKMQEEQAETLKGRWEKLKDAFDIGLQSIGDSSGLINFGGQMNILLGTLTLLAKNLRAVPKILEGATFAWMAYKAVLLATGRAAKAVVSSEVSAAAASAASTAGAVVGTKAHKRLTAAYIAEATATNFLTKSLAKLRIAFLTNPWTAAFAAIVGLATAFLSFRKSVDSVSSAFAEYDKAIENIAAAESKFSKMTSVINRYEKLAKKTERSADENLRLAQTMDILRENFRDVSIGIGDENEKLTENIDLLRKKNEEEEVEARRSAEKSLYAAKQQLEQLRRDEEEAQVAYDGALHMLRTLEGRNEERVLTKKALARENKKVAESEQRLNDIREQRTKLMRQIASLERYLDPSKADEALTTWQKTIKEMSSFKVDDISFSLVSPQDIEGYESLYKALSKIDKLYKDSSESAKEMRAALSSVSSEFRAEAENELAIEEARRDAAKAILDRFGYISSIDKKRGTSELTLLKEELKNVQDIYKKYQELLKTLPEGAAQDRIREIYGGVTAIDFLNPEDFKKRLNSILAELRKLQGRIKKGAFELTADWSKDLKETIRQNEGFMGKAEKKFGEAAPTVGYGFYNTLPDGTKIVEGMQMSVDEAERQLDIAISKTSRIIQDYITKYGNGMLVNTEQFNILMDLAHHGGVGLVKKLLEEAKGDNETIITLLKQYATTAKYGDKSIEPALRARAMRRAEGWRKAVAGLEEDSDAVSSAILDAEKIVQDVDWDILAKKLEQKIKETSDEVKRSEAARNLYENMLNLTGDENLAANLSISVYGDIGKEFKDRIQDQLNEAFDTFDVSDYNLWDSMRVAVDNQDWNKILAHLDKFPEQWRSVLKQMASDSQKYDSDLAKSFADLVSKYGDSAQKIATIRAKAEHEINSVIEAATKAADVANPVEREEILNRAEELIKSIEGRRDLDIFKLSDDYIKFFSEINVLTAKQAAHVRGELRNAYLDAFHSGAIDADELTRNLNAVDTQFKKLSESAGLLGSYLSGGFEKANEKLQEYADNVTVLAAKMKAGQGLDEAEQTFASKMLKKFGSGDLKGIKSYSDLLSMFESKGQGLKEAGEAFGQMGESMSAMAAEGPGAIAIVDAIIKAVNQSILAIQSVIDELNKTRSEENKIGDGFRYLSDFNNYAYSGWEKLKSGDVIGAVADTANSVISIFNNIQIGKVKRLNEQIEQQGRLLKDLEYAYSRLDAAIEDSFGTDYVYNYNKQVETLQAQAEAYRKQAELERKKGKSADEETARGYEESAREIEDRIKDMQGQLAEFFTGTDLTSAAQDFAKAWIDAYKEFGSTTDAMKEKFNEMVENMVVNSLAAKLIQDILRPVFDQIDAASKDGELTAQEIGSISSLVPERVKMINDAMAGMVNQLGAAGINLRNTVGQFSGISRNIAGASEESINGLAAGINTQNFYMQHIDLTVSAILSVLSGGTAGTTDASGAEVVDPYKNQMLMYVASLPQMRDDMASVRAMLEKVIRPVGTTTTHYVAVKL